MIRMTIGDVGLVPRPANPITREVPMRRVTIEFDVIAPQARGVAESVMEVVFRELGDAESIDKPF